MTAPTNNRELLEWLDTHQNDGRKLQLAGRRITNQASAKAWHEDEINWSKKLVATVKPRDSSWAWDLEYLGENFQRGRGEKKNLKYKEANFVKSVQFHAARLCVLRDYRGELRFLSVRPKPKPKRGRRPIGKNPMKVQAQGWAKEQEQGRKDGLTYLQVAEIIAEREDIKIATVKREAYGARNPEKMKTE